MKQHRTWMASGHTFYGFEDRVGDRCVVFFHGFTGHMAESGRLFYHLSKQFASKGLSTLRFDWFGHGESDLEFSEARVPLLLEQAEVVLSYALKQYRHVYLLGFSMGGALAMQASRNDVAKLILMAPAYRIGGMKQHYFEGREEPTRDLGGIVLHKDFPDGFLALDMVETVKQYDNPILIVQGENDEAVPKGLAEHLHKQLSHSELMVIPQADHCFHNRQMHDEIGKRILLFLNT